MKKSMGRLRKTPEKNKAASGIFALHGIRGIRRFARPCCAAGSVSAAPYAATEQPSPSKSGTAHRPPRPNRFKMLSHKTAARQRYPLCSKKVTAANKNTVCGRKAATAPTPPKNAPQAILAAGAAQPWASSAAYALSRKAEKTVCSRPDSTAVGPKAEKYKTKNKRSRKNTVPKNGCSKILSMRRDIPFSGGTYPSASKASAREKRCRAVPPKDGRIGFPPARIAAHSASMPSFLRALTASTGHPSARASFSRRTLPPPRRNASARLSTKSIGSPSAPISKQKGSCRGSAAASATQTIRSNEPLRSAFAAVCSSFVRTLSREYSPGRSVRVLPRSPVSAQKDASVPCVVTPGRFPTGACAPVSRLNSADLPQLGAPTSTALTTPRRAVRQAAHRRSHIPCSAP